MSGERSGAPSRDTRQELSPPAAQDDDHHTLLHWVLIADVEFAEASGTQVPALCDEWIVARFATRGEARGQRAVICPCLLRRPRRGLAGSLTTR